MTLKSNNDLGYRRVHEISEGTADAGESQTVHLQIGARCRALPYRAYAYLYYHAQDASSEGVVDRLCARGATPGEAIAGITRVAEDQWNDNQSRGLRRAVMEIEESLNETGEGRWKMKPAEMTVSKLRLLLDKCDAAMGSG